MGCRPELKTGWTLGLSFPCICAGRLIPDSQGSGALPLHGTSFRVLTLWYGPDAILATQGMFLVRGPLDLGKRLNILHFLVAELDGRHCLWIRCRLHRQETRGGPASSCPSATRGFSSPSTSRVSVHPPVWPTPLLKYQGVLLDLQAWQESQHRQTNTNYTPCVGCP